MGLNSRAYKSLQVANYEYFKMRKTILSYYTFSIRYFAIYKHKKLSYFHFLFKNKFYNYSNGQLLRNRVKFTKSFKKSIRSIGGSINILNKKLKKNLQRIHIFFIKNFSKSLYLWVKKFFYLIKPKIYMFVVTDS